MLNAALSAPSLISLEVTRRAAYLAQHRITFASSNASVSAHTHGAQAPVIIPASSASTSVSAYISFKCSTTVVRRYSRFSRGQTDAAAHLVIQARHCRKEGHEIALGTEYDQPGAGGAGSVHWSTRAIICHPD